jgi:hypothetical protein
MSSAASGVSGTGMSNAASGGSGTGMPNAPSGGSGEKMVTVSDPRVGVEGAQEPIEWVTDPFTGARMPAWSASG